jgi:hypothetical protein
LEHSFQNKKTVSFCDSEPSCTQAALRHIQGIERVGAGKSLCAPKCFAPPIWILYLFLFLSLSLCFELLGAEAVDRRLDPVAALDLGLLLRKASRPRSRADCHLEKSGKTMIMVSTLFWAIIALQGDRLGPQHRSYMKRV